MHRESDDAQNVAPTGRQYEADRNGPRRPQDGRRRRRRGLPTPAVRTVDVQPPGLAADPAAHPRAPGGHRARRGRRPGLDRRQGQHRPHRPQRGRPGHHRRRHRRPAPLVAHARRAWPSRSATFTGLRRYVAFREARWVEASLRDRLFAHLQRLHFAFHDQTQTGQLMSRANTDLQQVQAFVVMIPLTISNAVTVLAVTVILFIIDPVLTLLALGSLPFLNVLATRFSRRLFPSVMGIQRESAELAAVVEESVAGVRVIKGLGAEGVQAAAPRGRGRGRLRRVDGRGPHPRPASCPASSCCPTSGSSPCSATAATRCSTATSASARCDVQRLHRHADLAAAHARHDRRPGAAGGRVGRAGRRGAVDRARGRRPRPPGVACRRAARRGALRAACASATAGPIPVLDGFDLRVAPGESVALVGATGSGKTTVARLIPRFYDVEDGRRPPSTASTSATCACASCGARSASCSRTRSCSATRSPPTSPSPTPTPRTTPSSGRPAWPAPTSSSRACPRATPPRSASGATRCRAGSASASPSPGRSWPTPAC